MVPMDTSMISRKFHQFQAMICDVLWREMGTKAVQNVANSGSGKPARPHWRRSSSFSWVKSWHSYGMSTAQADFKFEMSVYLHIKD